MTTKELRTVAEWHNALNTKNKNGISALVQQKVKMGGPKGEVEGIEVMLEWVDRAQVTLKPKRYFASGKTIIVEELGEWHSSETGKVVGSGTVASVFLIDQSLIASVHRYDDLPTAFNATGLSYQDEVNLDQ